MKVTWKTFSIIGGIAAMSVIVGSAYSGYELSTTLSPYEKAASKMGLQTTGQHDALLKTFYLAGYFKPDNVWIDINRLGLKNPQDVFKSVMSVAIKSGATQDDPENFNPKILRMKLSIIQ